MAALPFACTTLEDGREEAEWPNARYLALRHQSGIHLDSDLESVYEAILDRAGIVTPVSSCTGVYPDFRYDTVSVASVAEPVRDRWIAGEVLTGYRPLDEFAQEFGFSEVVYREGQERFTIRLDRELRTDRLAELLASLEVIGFAQASPLNDVADNTQPNILLGEPTEDEWELLYIVGWGDCPAGCIEMSYWRTRVPKDPLQPARLIETYGDEIPPGMRESCGLE